MKYYIRFTKNSSNQEIERIIRKAIPNIETIKFLADRALVAAPPLNMNSAIRSLALNSNGGIKTIENVAHGLRIPVRVLFNSSSASASFYQRLGENLGHNIMTPYSPCRKQVVEPPPYISVRF